MQRYQLYLSQKLAHKAFQALRYPQTANMTPGRPHVAKASQSKQVLFEDAAPAEFTAGLAVTPNSILKVKSYYNRSRVAETQPNQLKYQVGRDGK